MSRKLQNYLLMAFKRYSEMLAVPIDYKFSDGLATMNSKN
jgi:hypothetical protein